MPMRPLRRNSCFHLEHKLDLSMVGNVVLGQILGDAEKKRLNMEVSVKKSTMMGRRYIVAGLTVLWEEQAVRWNIDDMGDTHTKVVCYTEG